MHRRTLKPLHRYRKFQSCHKPITLRDGFSIHSAVHNDAARIRCSLGGRLSNETKIRFSETSWGFTTSQG